MKADRRRPDSELVRDIMHELRPLKTGTPAATATAAVLNSMNILRDVVPKFFTTAARDKTKESAERIRRAVEKLEDEIRNASPEMRLRLEMRLLISPLTASEAPAALTDAISATLAECDAVLGKKDNDLKDEDEKTGESVNRPMAWCAREAWRLIVDFSTRLPSSSTARSPFRIVASVLYEAVTGEYGKDLRRTCDRIHHARLHLLPPKKSRKRG